MSSFQLKITIKKSKPPVWKRCIIPAGITFSQLALVLEEVLEEQFSESYEFEFYQAGIHLREWREGERMVTKWNYDYRCASDTFIDGLLNTEGWFTFRVTNGDEYRAEIEKCLQEEEVCPFVIKQSESPENRKWRDVDEENQRLRERFFVSYGQADYSSYEELYQQLTAENYGLKGAETPVDRQERSQKSGQSVMQDLADALREMSEMKPEEKCPRDRKEKSRNPDIKEYLSGLTLNELRRMAADLSLSGFSKMKKEELAGALRDELLKPDVMEKRMLLLSDGEIEAFEKVMGKKDGCYPEPDELEKLERLYQLSYLMIYTDSCVEVPREAARTYERINTPEYQKRRREAFWMYHCLLFVELLYAAAPERILCRMLKNCLGYPVSREAFAEIFERIPVELNPCVRKDGKVIQKETLRDEMYRDIERVQGEKEFYIPSPEEILDYTENGYPTADPGYLRLKSFLIERMDMEEEEVEDLLPVFWNHISMGSPMSDIMDIFEKMQIVFPSEQVVREFISLITNLNNHTRMLPNRGWTPQEIMERTMGGMNGKLSPIVPVSSVAADMPKESADEIPVMLMPQGTSGKMVAGSRKVYQNDPCPCGSGKKYKKCCGRKR